MAALSDLEIRMWIKTGERFEGRSDGNGLVLRFREDYTAPIWRFRYRFAGKARVMDLGSYAVLSLADARKQAKALRARVSLGHDVAGEKKERKRNAVAKIEAERNRMTLAQLADKFFERQIMGKWKHPNIVRSRIENDIKPAIGNRAVDEVIPQHIDEMLQAIVKRGAPTIANDVLRWTRRIYLFGNRHGITKNNPAMAFALGDAGGAESPRDRFLSQDKLVKLFQAMPVAAGFSAINAMTYKLLLLLAVRKMELCAARVDEFDLRKSQWTLPAERSKTGKGIVIPLPPQAADIVRELIRLGDGSEYLLPARKAQDRMLPHIHENTLNQAMAKLRPQLGNMPNFTVHDFRRTAKTHLMGLGTPPHIAERCLNHAIKGVEGIYDRYDYLPERTEALNKWATLLDSLARGESGNVRQLPTKRKA